MMVVETVRTELRRVNCCYKIIHIFRNYLMGRMSSDTTGVATPKINNFYRTNGILRVVIIRTLRGMQKANRGIRSDQAQMAGTNLSEALSVTRKRWMHKSQAELRDKHRVSVVWASGGKRIEQFHTSAFHATLVFWVMAKCSLAGGYRCFGGKCRLRHQKRCRPIRLHGVIIQVTTIWVGARGGVVVKALRYKPAGRGFDSRCYHWNFSMT